RGVPNNYSKENLHNSNENQIIATEHLVNKVNERDLAKSWLSRGGVENAEITLKTRENYFTNVFNSLSPEEQQKWGGLDNYLNEYCYKEWSDKEKVALASEASRASNNNVNNAKNNGVEVEQKIGDLSLSSIKNMAENPTMSQDHMETCRKILNTVKSKEELIDLLNKARVASENGVNLVLDKLFQADDEVKNKMKVLGFTAEDLRYCQSYQNFAAVASEDNVVPQSSPNPPPPNIKSIIDRVKPSKPEPIQELAPENKGKPDSQVSLVSAIATPKPTRTYKQEQTEQEKDEERRKREEKDIIDRVEPNRTADHSPRALNEKNTTASIEEQKIILAQQERNMTQEEKMRMEQEKANNVNASKGIEV
ncbi:hypothetical protein ACWIYZ_07945, partial [Ursidibacter arcticus]